MNPEKPYDPWNAPNPQPWDAPDPQNVFALRGEDPNGSAPCDVDPHATSRVEMTCFACQRRYPAGNEICSQCGRRLSPPKPFPDMGAPLTETSDHGCSIPYLSGGGIGNAIVFSLAILGLVLLVVSALHYSNDPLRHAAPVIHGFEGGQ